MMRFRLGQPLGIIFTAILLSGCDHHKSANQAHAEAGAGAAANTDSAYTGQPAKSKYPRALPVAPPQAISEANPPSVTNSSSPSPATPSSAPSATPAPTDTASPLSPASNPPPVSTPAPVPSSDTLTSLPATAPSTGGTSDITQPTNTPPAPITDDTGAAQQQVVVLQTSLGQIVIQLDDFAAPKTCDNFRKLVSDGFYNRTAFHRVIPNFIIQGGDPNSKSDNRSSYGQGGPNYTVPAEIKLKHDRGAVAMARLPDSVNPQHESNGSQFYICVVPCPSLDDQYTVFGHVIKGLDVAAKIAGQPRDTHDNPFNRIEMEASLEAKGKALEEGSTVSP